LSLRKKESEGVWINQDAKFYLGNLKKGFQTDYSVSQKGNGVYAFVVEGDVSINGQKLNKRDGFGIWDIDKFSVTADSDSELLLMDVANVRLKIQDVRRKTRDVRLKNSKQGFESYL